MRYFLAIFCSPLAILLAGRPIAAILNAFLYLAAFVGWLLGGLPGLLLWGLGVLHAWMVISGAKADRRIERAQSRQETR